MDLLKSCSSLGEISKQLKLSQTYKNMPKHGNIQETGTN